LGSNANDETVEEADGNIIFPPARSVSPSKECLGFHRWKSRLCKASFPNTMNFVVITHVTFVWFLNFNGSMIFVIFENMQAMKIAGHRIYTDTENGLHRILKVTESPVDLINDKQRISQ
jgi:hypothetical protein